MKGIRLPSPHGTMVVEGKKKLIVTTDPIPDDFIGDEIFLIEDDDVIGKIKINKSRGPFNADGIRRAMRGSHLIDDEEWDARALEDPRWRDKVYMLPIAYVEPVSDISIVVANEGLWIDEIEEKKQEILDPVLRMNDEPRKGVIQAHFNGEDVHLDFRVEHLNEMDRWYLVGWTIDAARKEAFIDTVDTIEEARDVGAHWDEYFRITNEAETYKQPRSKLFVEAAGPESYQWINAEGVITPGEITPVHSERGVMYIVDRPTVYVGAQKEDFVELFLEGETFNGRWIIRRMPADWVPDEMAFEFADLMWKPTDQMPYVLSQRAVNNGWIPPSKASCLPAKLRSQIPPEFQYWEAEDIRKTRDLLVEAIKQGEVILDDEVVIEEPSEEAFPPATEEDPEEALRKKYLLEKIDLVKNMQNYFKGRKIVKSS